MEEKFSIAARVRPLMGLEPRNRSMCRSCWQIKGSSLSSRFVVMCLAWRVLTLSFRCLRTGSFNQVSLLGGRFFFLARWRKEVTVANFVEKHSKACFRQFQWPIGAFIGPGLHTPRLLGAKGGASGGREWFCGAPRGKALRNRRFDQPPAPPPAEVQRLVEGQTKLWATLDQVRQDLTSAREPASRELSPLESIGFSGLSLGLGPLDLEELRTQICAERLAREQGDDRCMENMRDLITEASGFDGCGVWNRRSRSEGKSFKH